MRKKIYLIVFITSLLLSCSSNKVLDQSFYSKHNQKDYKMKNKHSTFKKIFESKSKRFKQLNDKLDTKFDQEKEYDFKNPNLEWNVNLLSNTKQEYTNLENHIAPSISPFGTYLLSFNKESTILESGKRTIPYDLVLYHMHSRNKVTLYKFDDSQFQYDFMKKYNLVKWAPYGDIFAFIGQHNGLTNVYLYSIMYDKVNQEIIYSAFQLTNNKHTYQTYYDLQWSKRGDKIAYTVLNGENDSYVEIYDIRSNSFQKIGENKNISHFRFGLQDEKMALYAQKKNGLYSVFLCNNYEKDVLNDRTLLMTCNTPYIFSSFGYFSDKLVILNYNINKVNIVYYDYHKEKKIIKQEDISFTDRDLFLFEPISDSAWFYFDNTILFSSNHELKTISFKPEYKYVSLLKGNHINSVTSNLENEIFYSSLHGRRYKIISIRPNLNSRYKGKEIEENWYSIVFKNIDPKTSSARINLSKNPMPSAPIVADQLGGIQVYPEEVNFDALLTINPGRKIEDLKIKKTYYVSCPKILKRSMKVFIEGKMKLARIKKLNNIHCE